VRAERVNRDILKSFTDSLRCLTVPPTGQEVIATLACLLVTAVTGVESRPGQMVFRGMTNGYEVTVKKMVSS
jgi:hypothetical protein